MSKRPETPHQHMNKREFLKTTAFFAGGIALAGCEPLRNALEREAPLPAGQLILLELTETGWSPGSITSLDLKTNERTELLQHEAASVPPFISASPNGDKLALVFNPDLPRHEISIFDIQSRKVVHKISTEEGIAATPSWSPDGTMLAYHTFDFSKGLTTYITKADATEPLLKIPNAYSPQFLPGVGNEYFAYTLEEDGKKEVIIAAISGEAEETAIDISATRSSRLSPDGRKISFQRPLDDNKLNELIAYEITTGDEKVIVHFVQDVVAPEIWSPDSTRIAYFKSPDGSTFGRLTARDLSTGEETILSDRDFRYFHAFWLDNTWIAASDADALGKKGFVWLFNVETGEQRDLTNDNFQGILAWIPPSN